MFFQPIIELWIVVDAGGPGIIGTEFDLIRQVREPARCNHRA